jgi:sugar phosphate permease
VLAVVVRCTLREPPRGLSERLIDSGRTPPWRAVIRHLWSVRSYRHIVAAVALQSITWYGIYQWSPSFFKRSHGLMEGQAAIELGLVFGASGIFGMLGAGALADHLSRKDRRWYLWLCTLGALAQVPLIAAALLVESRRAALGFLFVPVLIGSLFTVVPVTVVQGLAPPRMRATADAIRIFFAMSLIGHALGATLIGYLSHVLEPRFGRDSLRYALLAVIAVANPAAAGYYFSAARTVAGDLEDATARSRRS